MKYRCEFEILDVTPEVRREAIDLCNAFLACLRPETSAAVFDLALASLCYGVARREKNGGAK